MRHTLYTAGLGTTNSGFFVEPIAQDDPKFLGDPRRQAWLQLERVLQQAKRGDFSEVISLCDIFDSDDLGFGGACSELLAHAGTPACFSRVRDMVRGSELDWEGKIDLCLALAVGDTLSAVPLLVETYLSLWKLGAEGVEMIPHMICHELEATPERCAHPEIRETGPDLDKEDDEILTAYAASVMERHKELAQRFGSDHVHVDRGEQFGVIALAERLLRDIAAGDLHWVAVTRFRFEASTGVDCRGFYDGSHFRPLRATAIIAEFLESPAARHFEPGVRYFFGHRIPAR